MDFARVGIDQGVLDHRYVNLLTQYSVGEWYRREFMNAAGTYDQPLPGNLTKHWSTYGARGLLAQTHGPMTGTWPLQCDVLHGEIVLNDHLGSPRLRLESQLQAVVDEEGEDPTDILDWVVAGWAYRNPMDDTPFGRELPLSAEAKTTPEGYTGKPLDTTFGLQAMNYGARFYDPRLGRWWQRDPLAEKYAAWTPFAYSVCSPVSNYDPDGRDTYVVSPDGMINSERLVDDLPHGLLLELPADQAGPERRIVFHDPDEDVSFAPRIGYNNLSTRYVKDEAVHAAHARSGATLQVPFPHNLTTLLAGSLPMGRFDFVNSENLGLGFYERNGVAYSSFDFGNCLWGGAAARLGIDLWMARLGAHGYTLLSKRHEPDSSSDQKAIINGYYNR
jgi:RHS repeat-associated protein